MKKSTKIIRLSVTLLLLIAMLLTPMSPIFAVVIENGDADLTAADIVSEDASKREKFSRHYLTGDGTYFAVSYAEQVNYQDDDGNWIAVDNSLSTNVLTGEKSTKNEKFKVKFANKANKEDLVTIKTYEYDVSFGITVSEDGENYLELNKVKGTESESNTSAEPKTTQEATSLGKAVSGITYVDAFSDYLDVRYSVAHEKVKEDLILERKSSFSSYKVTYNIKEKDAFATLNDDGSITFTNPDGAVLFNVGVPVMYDSDGKSSADIAVSMTQTKKTVEVTYTPSAEWLNAEDRVYPVTIDPEMSTNDLNLGSSNIEDVSVYYMTYSQDDILVTTPYIRLGMDNTAYIKFHNVPTISSEYEFSSSAIVFQGSSLYVSDENEACSVTIGDTSVEWDETTFVYEEGDEYPEYLSVNQTSTLNNLYFDYNNNESNPNYIVEIGLHDFYTNESEYINFYNSTYGFRIDMSYYYEFTAHSSEYSVAGYRPALVVRYDESNILESDPITGTAVTITGTHWIKNDSSSEYLTFNETVSIDDYIDYGLTQLIYISYNTISSFHYISRYGENVFLGCSIDDNEQASYSLNYSTSISSTEKWDIYEVSDGYIVVNESDPRYVLTQNDNSISVAPYSNANGYQVWNIYEFDNLIISEQTTEITLMETNIKHLWFVENIVEIYSYDENIARIFNDTLYATKYGIINILAYSDSNNIYTINVTVLISNGIFLIKNKESEYFLQKSPDGINRAEHWSFKSQEVEKLTIEHQGDGYYHIKYSDSELLTALSTSSNIGDLTFATQFSGTDGDRQLWRIEPTGNDAWVIKPKLWYNLALTAYIGNEVIQDTYSDDFDYSDEWEIFIPSEYYHLVLPIRIYYDEACETSNEEIENMFNEATLAFEEIYRIKFVLQSIESSSELNLSTECHTGAGTCTADCGNPTLCASLHHRNALALLNKLSSNTVYTLRLVSYGLCRYDTSEGHLRLRGRGVKDGKDTVVTLENIYKIQAIQHELSHNLGASHNTCLKDDCILATILLGEWCDVCDAAIRRYGE